jgi:hypothetical protein
MFFDCKLTKITVNFISEPRLLLFTPVINKIEYKDQGKF